LGYGLLTREANSLKSQQEHDLTPSPPIPTPALLQLRRRRIRHVTGRRSQRLDLAGV